MNILNASINKAIIRTTLFFMRTSKIEVQAGCSEFVPDFEAELFLICS